MSKDPEQSVGGRRRMWVGCHGGRGCHKRGCRCFCIPEMEGSVATVGIGAC